MINRETREQVFVKGILKDIKTWELVEELKKREAVETHVAEPYEDLTVTANGPAIVLVVTD